MPSKKPYDVCPNCGAHLDHGEHCDCDKDYRFVAQEAAKRDMHLEPSIYTRREEPLYGDIVNSLIGSGIWIGPMPVPRIIILFPRRFALELHIRIQVALFAKYQIVWINLKDVAYFQPQPDIDGRKGLLSIFQTLILPDLHVQLCGQL